MDSTSNLGLKKKRAYRLVSGVRGNRSLVLKSLRAAEKWHAGQKRADDAPYITHIYNVVASLIEEFKVTDAEVIAAGALHDVIEDCGVTEKELRRKFGGRVASIVRLESQNFYKSRREYLAAFKKASETSKTIKVADRLDNLRMDLSKVKRPREKVVQYLIESERYVLPVAKSVDKRAWREMRSIIDRITAMKKFRPLYKSLLLNDKAGYKDEEKKYR